MMLFSLHLLGTWFLVYNVQFSVVYSMFPPRLMRRMYTSLNGQQLKVINFIVVYCSCKKRKEMKDYYVKSPASLPPEDTTPDIETWNLELSRVRYKLALKDFTVDRSWLEYTLGWNWEDYIVGWSRIKYTVGWSWLEYTVCWSCLGYTAGWSWV